MKELDKNALVATAPSSLLPSDAGDVLLADGSTVYLYGGELRQAIARGIVPMPATGPVRDERKPTTSN